MDAAVDQRLRARGADAGGGEDRGQVVRDDAAAVPLRGDAQSDGDEEAVPVPGGSEHGGVAVVGGFGGGLFEGEGALDFGELEVGEGGGGGGGGGGGRCG